MGRDGLFPSGVGGSGPADASKQEARSVGVDGPDGGRPDEHNERARGDGQGSPSIHGAVARGLA